MVGLFLHLVLRCKIFLFKQVSSLSMIPNSNSYAMHFIQESKVLKRLTNCFAEIFGIRDSQTVEILQDQAQVLLGEYVRHQYPRQPTRFGKLLLMMPSLRVITGAVLARLFFKETVGNIPVERLICDIYQTEKVQ